MKGVGFMNSQKIMEILWDECQKELEAAKKAEKILKRTWNPFKRRKIKEAFDIFTYHHAALLIAIHRIQREASKLQD